MAARATDPDAIDESAVIRRRAHVGTVRVRQDAVLVDEAAGRAHAVNATGALVWECLDGNGDLAGLVDDLAEGFGAERATVAHDVLDLTRGLARLGLIEGIDAVADAWPAELAPLEDDACVPDEAAAAPSFDDRYLAAPPNA